MKFASSISASGSGRCFSPGHFLAVQRLKLIPRSRCGGSSDFARLAGLTLFRGSWPTGCRSGLVSLSSLKISQVRAPTSRSRHVVNSPPDGYTLLFIAASAAANVSLFETLYSIFYATIATVLV